MLREDGVYYYCNLSSPFVFDNNAIKYIDYDLDIKVFPDMSYTLLDEDEYELHRKEMSYPDVIDKILKRNVDKLISWIQQKEDHLHPISSMSGQIVTSSSLICSQMIIMTPISLTNRCFLLRDRVLLR